MEITEQTPTETIQRSGRRFILNIIVAFVAYCLAALYLFEPYIDQFHRFDYLYAIGPVAGALGACIVIYKWSGDYFSAVPGGLFYGFSPLAMAIGAYHPLAMVPMIMLPWLFLPAVYLEKKLPDSVCGLLLLLPGMAIVAYFMVLGGTSIGPFFPMPLRVTVSMQTFTGFGMMESFSSERLPFGYYHVGPWLLLLGIVVYIRQHRPAVIGLAVVGLVLSFCEPVFGVSPVLWALIPVLFGTVLISQTMDFLIALSGKEGRSFLIGAMVVLYGWVVCDVILESSKIVDYIF